MVDQEQAEAFVSRWMHEYNGDKARFVEEMYADDVEISVAGLFTLHGRDEVWEALGPLYEGPVAVQISTIHRVLAQGDTIVVEFDTRLGDATHHACSILDVAGGRVVRDRSYSTIASVPDVG